MPVANRQQPCQIGISLPLRERQLAAQGNETLVTNIGSLSEAMGKTSSAAESVLSASGELTAMAETLSREVDTFFRNLRADPHEGMRKAG